MAEIETEIAEWAGILQIETGDDVIGGKNGIANAQALAFAKRTNYLRIVADSGARVGSMAALKSYQATGVQGFAQRASGVTLSGFYAGQDGGGGEFVFDNSMPRSSHNGGTIIDPSHPSIPGDPDWYAPQGSGTGCWVRKRDKGIAAEWFGARAAVANDQAQAFQTALNACANGDEFIIGPGEFTLRSGLTTAGKSLTVRGFATVLRQTTNIQVLTFEGEWSAIRNVTNLDMTTVLSDGQNSDIRGSTITLDQVPVGWKTGDTIKVFADDEIPGARPQSGTARMRVGEFFTIYTIVGNAITFAGRPIDPMTVNVRVAKLMPHSLDISGVRFESDDPINYTGGGLVVRSALAPKIDVTFGSMPQICGSTRSCWAPNVRAVVARSNNDPTNNRPGYAWHDAGSEGGTFNIVASHCRHAYTDDNNAVEAGDENPWRYGRPSNHKVTGVAKGTSATAWGTHSTARNVVFSDCLAIDCQGAFSLRGYENKILNCAADYCSDNLLLFDEDRLNASSDSYSHVVDGFIVTNPRESSEATVIGVTANAAAGTPATNQRVMQASFLDNIVIIGHRRGILRAVNQSVRVGKIRSVAAAAMENGSYAVRGQNSEIIIDDLDIDYRANTSGTSLNIFRDLQIAEVPDRTSRIEVKRGRLRCTEAVAARIVSFADGLATTVWDIENFRMDYRPAGLVPVNGALGSRIDYTVESTGVNRGFITALDANIEGAGLPLLVSQSRLPVVSLRLTPSTANRTLAKFNPGAFQGQVLYIENALASGETTVIVPHGTATYAFFNFDGQDVSLRPRESSLWIWEGTAWRQILPVNRSIMRRRVVTQNSSASVTGTQDVVTFIAAGTSTLPTAVANVNRYVFKNISATAKSIASANSETFDGAAGPYSLAAGASVEFVSDGAGWRAI